MPLKVKNIAAGFHDAQGRFHPIRAAADYVPGLVGETAKWKKASVKKFQQAAKKAAQIAAAAKAAAKAKAKSKVKAKAKTKAKAKATARKRNPIPTGRYIDAKIMRTRKGDLKVIIPVK